MKPRIPWLVAVLVGAAFALAHPPHARAADPEILAEHWDLMRIGGNPAGHVHTIVRRKGTPEAPLIETTATSRMEMARLGETMVIEEESVTTERPDGSLVSIRKNQKASALETLVEVTFGDAQAVMATTAMGQRREAKVPVPAGTVGPAKSERIPIEAGLKAGTKHEIRTFAVDLGGAAVATVTVGAAEEVETLDGKQRLVRLDSTLDVLPVRTAAWVTPEGSTLATRMEIGGMVIETLRGTKEQVLEAQAGKKGAAEVFEGSMIRTRHLIPHARAIDGALMRVTLRRPDVVLSGLEDERQKIEAREAEGALLVRVRRVVPPGGAGGKRPLAKPPEDIAPYLVSTSMLQADDPLIKHAAQEAVGAETDAWKAAQAIEAWVYKAIGKKNMGVAFASALEVCTNREGDCTEHAVLAAALCRAAGIPSRVALGLEYLTGIFGGHAWTEVWIDGRWYPIDATLGTGSADALHLTLGRLALAEGTYGREYASFIDAVGSIEIDVREVTWQGKTLRLDRPDAVVAEEGRYVNRLWGIAVAAPSGFSLKPRGPAEGLSQRIVDLKGKSAAGAERRVRVRAESLGHGETLDDAVRMYAGSAAMTSATIDGRPARVAEIDAGEKRLRIAFVIDDGDSLFMFGLEPFEGDADATFFDIWLEGVDLDAEDAQPAAAPRPRGAPPSR
jgi:transglutaminase-like putative cysteine protease